LTTQAVLLEIGNALARGKKSLAIDIVERLSTAKNSQVIKLSSKHFDEAFKLYTAYDDKEWGLVDCISFVVMREKE
jgi:uncharacterized protein